MKIIPQLTTKNTVYINRNMDLKRGYIYFGNKSCEIKINQLPELADEEILMSINIINKLCMPIFCNYDIRVDSNKIIIGAYIGILTSKTKDVLEDVVDSHKNYVYDYKHIGGCVVVFSLDGVNKQSELIEGYAYNPCTDKFEKGIFAIPSVILKRIGLNKKWREYLNKITDGKMFNDLLISKWQAYKLLKDDIRIVPYLPETILYKKPKDAKLMLDAYSEIYLKHIYGSQGKGIITLKKSGKWVLAKIAGIDKKFVLKNDYEINQFLYEHVPSGQYIAQQAIDLLNLNGRKIDFRIATVKDANGMWSVPYMVSRFGVQGNIVSNVSSGGSAVMAYDAVKNLMKLSEREIYLLLCEMKQLAVNIGKCLCSKGDQCGNLGVDLALDTKAHIWIIEVNNKDPNHTIAIDAKNRSSFYETKLSNMLYAKYLCGFGREVNDGAKIY